MISQIKINDDRLLSYSLNKIYENQHVNIDNFIASKNFVTFGQYIGNDPYWVVSFYDFTKDGDCTMDIVLNHRGLISIDTINRIGYIAADYAFRQNNRVRVSTMVRASNKRSLRLTSAFGFKHEGTIRNGYTKPIIEDKILFGMLRDECPWLNGDKK